MKPELKPGCLAIVIRDDYFQENVNRFVTVVREAVGPDLIDVHYASANNRQWVVRAPGLLWGYVSLRSGDISSRWTTDERIYSAKCLRPIADPDSYDHRDEVVALTREKCDATLDRLGLIV